MFRMSLILFLAAALPAAGADPQDAIDRLKTAETAVSVYDGGGGEAQWTEDLQALETMWDCVSPQTRAEFRDFLLPLYMRESMGFPLFEEGDSEWLETAEKLLFDDSF